MEKNLKNIRDEFKKNGIFYTTPELAEMLKQYVDFEPERIYDPTCGQGNLLSVFDDEVEKYGQEIYADELDKARERLTNFVGFHGDTLKNDGFSEMKFDLIVANPPFSIKWEPDEKDKRFIDAPCLPPPSKADYAFLLHILHHLSDQGKAICLEFPGVLYRGQREGKIREWMIKQNYVERVVHVPGNTFVDTSIATCVIVLNKSKATTDIIFEDREAELERSVSAEEVEANGYILSVSQYVVTEEKHEEVDPEDLEMHARRQFLTRLERELEFEREVCKIEGISILPFIRAIEHVLKRFKAEV